ncbi:hypothetical protein E2C01_095404 [Portunus trituberculatus]|uniref:Uncharacterized protein n=1 Tax=Portunus trituberculatus TaxID=210409 RepID=A0A5B7K3Q6_PORTR|nr:hypothetical protein [Portunus trituberculatus]
MIYQHLLGLCDLKGRREKLVAGYPANKMTLRVRIAK